MTDIEDMTLAEIKARLDELDDRKARAEDFRDLVGETSDNLQKLQRFDFVDEDLAAKLDMLQTMLDVSIHHGVTVEQGVRYERELLHREKWERERQEDSDAQ